MHYNLPVVLLERDSMVRPGRQMIDCRAERFPRPLAR